MKNTTKPIFDFSDYIAECTQDFTGREWVFAEIDAWLATPDAPRYFIITGEPGIGKTALAGRLTQIRSLDATHFCITRQADTIDPLNFVRSISHQLTRIEGFAQNILKEKDVQINVHISNVRNVQNVIGVQIENLMGGAESAAIAFSRVVTSPLRQLYADGFDRQMVILVDALDEAVRQPGTETIVSLLENAWGLPEPVRFLLTARPDADALRHFEELKLPYLQLDAGHAENLEDIREYVAQCVEASDVLQTRLSEQDTSVETFLERVTTASQCNFLYLVWLLRGIAEGTQQFKTLDDLPDGLDGIYREFLRTRTVGENRKNWQNMYRPLLGVLAAAQAPLTAEQLTVFSGLSEQDVIDLLLDVRQFLAPGQAEQGLYQLYHQSLPDFFQTEERAKEFWIELPTFHRQIATYYQEQCVGRWGDSDMYGLHYLPTHQIQAGLWDELEQVLTDLHFIETKGVAGMIYELIADYNAAMDGLPEAQEENRQKRYREARVQEYIQDLIAYAKGEIETLKIIESIELWSEEKINADNERIKNNPTRFDRICAFAQFVNTESYALANFSSFSGFCIQQAYNSVNSGPVANAARAIVNKGMSSLLLLHFPFQCPDYNSHPALLRTIEMDCAFVDITPDGRWLISRGKKELQTLQVWDLKRGECLKTLEGHADIVTCVKITPDGRYAVSGGRDSTLRMWDLERGKCLRTFDAPEPVINVSITPDGRYAVSIGESLVKGYNNWHRMRTLRVWNLERGECFKTLGGEPYAASITPDGRRVVLCGHSTLQVWDLERDICVHNLSLSNPGSLEGEGGEVLRITPDSRGVIVSFQQAQIDDDTYVYTPLSVDVWDSEHGEWVQRHGQSSRFYRITPDRKLGISGNEVWNLENGKCIRRLREGIGIGHITADGKYGISVSDGDKTLQMWDLERGIDLYISRKSTSTKSVTITLDGKRAVFGNPENHALEVWDLERGECLKTLEGHVGEITSVSVTSNGRYAVSGDYVGEGMFRSSSLRVWDLDRSLCLGILKGHTIGVNNVSITPDGRRAISEGVEYLKNEPGPGTPSPTLRVWDLEHGTCLFTYEGLHNVKSSITPDGRHIVYHRYWITVRDMERDIESCNLEEPTANFPEAMQGVCIIPDGKYAVSYNSEGTLYVCDLKHGGCLRTLEGHSARITSAVITPDGKYAVSGSADNTLRMWDLKNGKCVKAFEGHVDEITSVSVTADGRCFLSGSKDRTLRVWDIKRGTCLGIYRARGGVQEISEIRTNGSFVYFAETGEFTFLRTHNLPREFPIVTPVRIWLYGKHQGCLSRLFGKKSYEGRWDDNITTVCLECGQSFPVAASILDIIAGITRTANLSEDQSPCLNLPCEAWDEPKLLSECPSCHQSLKFNPFVVDNRERNTR